MKDQIDEPAPVTRHLIPEDQRLAVVETIWGMHFFLRIEPAIYAITERMAPAYRGGYWDFWLLDNGGFYLSIAEDRVFQVSCDNHWQGPLTSDALSLTSCLYVYSHLSFSKDLGFARTCAGQYHRLRQFMFTHPEVTAILAAID